MKNIIKKILFEPLFHFMLMGIVLYGYYTLTTNEESKKQRIVLSTSDVNNLTRQSIYEENSFLLESFVENNYYEKVLLNEAFHEKLHLQDSTIVNTLIRKMQFLIDGEAVEPSEAILEEYYTKNLESYSVKTKITFYHFSYSILDVAQQEYIYKVLLQSDFTALQGNLTHEIMTPDTIQSMYGRYFSLKVEAQKKGLWSKAIQSKKGIHFVYVDSYETAEVYPFDEVIDRVYNDYKDEQLKQKRDSFYTKMQKKYELEVLND